MSPRVCLRGLIDRSAHLHLRSGARDPPDLDAIFRRVPVLATRFLSRAASLGDVQRSPLHRSSRGVRLPDGFGFASPLLLICPSGWKCRFPSAFRPRGFSPPRRFLLHDPATVFQAAADPGVHRVSSRVRTGSSRCTYCPSKLSLRRQLREPRRRISVSARGRVIGSIWTLACRPSLRSPRTLPPRPSCDLEALLHRRVRCSSGRCQPFVPGAPLGLSDPSRRRPVRLLLTASGEEARGRPRAGLSA